MDTPHTVRLLEHMRCYKSSTTWDRDSAATDLFQQFNVTNSSLRFISFFHFILFCLGVLLADEQKYQEFKINADLHLGKVAIARMALFRVGISQKGLRKVWLISHLYIVKVDDKGGNIAVGVHRDHGDVYLKSWQRALGRPSRPTRWHPSVSLASPGWTHLALWSSSSLEV